MRYEIEVEMVKNRSKNGGHKRKVVWRDRKKKEGNKRN